jgi:tetratricopeptide (TPR) repeat protein
MAARPFPLAGVNPWRTPPLPRDVDPSLTDVPVAMQPSTPTVERAPLGLIQQDMLSGRLDRAEAAARDFLRAFPRDPSASYLLGLILSRSGRLEESLFHLRIPAELPDAQRDCLCEYGRVLCALGKFNRGIELLRLATQRDLASAHAWEHLAHALLLQGSFADAVNAGEESVRIRLRSGGAAGGPNAMCTIGDAWAAMSDAPEAVKWHARAMQEFPDDLHAAMSWVRLLQYLDVSPADLATSHARVNDLIRRGHLSPSPRPPMTWTSGSRPLRVAFLSPDLRDHPVARFILPLLTSAEPSRVRWSIFHTHPIRDDVSRRCARYAQQCHHVAHLDDEALAAAIRASAPDVLIDLSGWGEHARATVLARRVAPLQAAYLRHPTPSALQGVDVRLVDAAMEPDALEASAWHPAIPEAPIAIPGASLCWTPPAERVECDRTPSKVVTFGSFCSPGKISPRCGRLWARIINTVPHARLLIKARGLGDRSTREHTLRALVRHGIEPSRIELCGMRPTFTEHLAWYNKVDIVLDPFPFNGTATTCEALWMGVPVISLQGASGAGRTGATILQAAGVGDNVCVDENAYLARAEVLAKDAAGRAEFRSSMRSWLLASPLCNAKMFAEQFLATLEILASRLSRAA